MGVARRRQSRLRLYCEQFRCVDNELGGLAPAPDFENALFAGKHDILAAGLHDRIGLHLKNPRTAQPDGKPQPRGRSYKIPMKRWLVYHLLTGSKTRDYRRLWRRQLRNLNAASEPDRHPDMAARKSEPLVEALRIDAGMMGQQFDQLAAPCAGFRQRPPHQLLADAAAAAIGGDADVLDQA